MEETGRGLWGTTYAGWGFRGFRVFRGYSVPCGVVKGAEDLSGRVDE